VDFARNRIGVRPQSVTSRSIRPSPLKSPGVHPVGAMVLSIGSGLASSTNGVNRSCGAAVGV